MAKPILLIEVPMSVSMEDLCRTTHEFSKRLEDYHVLMYCTDTQEHKFTALNDCKGLPDADIEALIADIRKLITNGKA